MFLTRDEERNLPRALTSLPREMPVFVLDAVSDDRTAEYARAAGATIVQRPWTDFVDARRFALDRIVTPWVLMIDADEALDDVLCEAILNAPADIDGYLVRRSTYFCGKALRMWRNEPLVRIFRRDRARIEANPAAGGGSALHEHIICDGRVEELPGTLLHFSYPTVSSYRSKFARYTSIEAEGLDANLLRAVFAVLLVPLRCALNLLGRGAWLDGPRGWYVAWWSALYPAVVVWKSLRGTART